MNFTPLQGGNDVISLSFLVAFGYDSFIESLKVVFYPFKLGKEIFLSAFGL